MIENLFADKISKKWNDHNGDGYILAHRILKYQPTVKTDFIDIAIIPPTSSIGCHKHGENEETYVILRGNGVMILEESEIAVKEGDIIQNPNYGKHGLINNSHEDLLLLVFQTSEYNQNENEGG